MNRVELLAPAGDMACFKAAVNAGADAVYLGGEEYGARAYASNFTKEELCEAICYAHLFGVKVYLTVNTLVKQRELGGLCDFIRPFYEAGLDGVIIQDFGVLQTLKEHFPGMELHGSTQMCVAGKYGAQLLKDYGVSRVVPARELSLGEIKEIKATGIEVEAFIHGAMCYCYSGQCLFSSFLGGRSGNRGRCAGPCRLPYSVYGKKEVYPLSLKDMCTLPIIHELIDAGIDSFKIEGRMKNPYYVAGVTAIYRKYIDLYEKSKEENIPYKVDKKDLDILRSLYVRTELESGYYHRHNGPEMVTLDKPGYVTGDEKQFTWIKEAYLDKDRKVELFCELNVKQGEVLKLAVWNGDGKTVALSGTQPITAAVNRPTTAEDVRKQLGKTGNTPFHFETISVIMDEDVFLPIKEINELRRQALDAIKEELVSESKRCVNAKETYDTNRSMESFNTDISDGMMSQSYRVVITTTEQLLAMQALIEKNPIYAEVISGVELHVTMLEQLEKEVALWQWFSQRKMHIYLCMPSVGRKRAISYCEQHISDEMLKQFAGFYFGNTDVLKYLLDRMQRAGISIDEKEMMADYSLYTCNEKAVSFLKQYGVDGIVGSYELNRHEWKELLSACSRSGLQLKKEYLIYGHIPFMQSAGCIKKTFGKCDGQNSVTMLTDRMGKKFPVVNVCQICENTVYNSVPLDLTKEAMQIPYDYARISFTIEDRAQTEAVMESILTNRPLPVSDFTKGHFKKGVE